MANLLWIHSNRVAERIKLQAQLMQAVKGRKHATVKRLLEIGVNPNCLDENGLTPLAYAVIQLNNEKVVELLLLHGADADAPSWGYEPSIRFTMYDEISDYTIIMERCGVDFSDFRAIDEMVRQIEGGCSRSVVASFLAQQITTGVNNVAETLLIKSMGYFEAGNRDVFSYLVSLSITELNTPAMVEALACTIDPYYLSTLLEAGFELSDRGVLKMIEYGDFAGKLTRALVLIDFGYTFHDVQFGESFGLLMQYLLERGRSRLA